MSARLGERLRGMLCGVGALFRVPYSGAAAESRPVLHGNMRRAIVVKTPDDLFSDTRNARSRRAGTRISRRWRCLCWELPPRC